ncbi:UvrD-helicase domain-containing protein (plasmid) [Embleya sp. NBC_00888]|uniref:nuclease-related domain-containing DEAD/DEAH box helicase n=1 Tax=Embleya sp. NBC_00888 TaxID=2975960 RepID=UPI002F919A1B|nr:UvrD-helicase domain-containing protein [Embleya sp. NBC_00888]
MQSANVGTDSDTGTGAGAAAPGGSLARLARDARARERELRREWAQARRVAIRYEAASQAEQRVVAHLLMLTGYGWRPAVDRRWPGTRTANVDLLLVGPAGVYVVDVKNWRAAPNIRNGTLYAGDQPRAGEAAKLLAITAIAEEAIATLGVSPVVVVPMMVFAGHRVDAGLGRIRLLGETQAAPDLLGRPARLDPESVTAIARRLERVFPVYEDPTEPSTTPATTTPPPSTTAVARTSPPGPLDASFDPGEFAAATLRAARVGPIERWMTYLDPGQCALVRADWPGPARITGPAGTGKTVVGLHRAAYLAQHGTGRVLYATFTANLPRVQRTFLATMAPVAVDRVDFSGIHAWALAFLNGRGGPPRELDPIRAAAAFDRAWAEVGRGGRLSAIAASAGYWRDEIDHVIKGRGITTFERYRRLPRPGRRTRLTRAGDREAVWRLYERYERLLRTEQVCDFNDVLAAALREVLRRGRQPAYASVIVDEVQDLSLVGVRLLHALVGDAANGLLLIGDGQQAVYPGGFRLAEAGITIPEERTHVLRRNYRNAPGIVRAALAVVGADGFEDLEHGRVTGPRPLELDGEASNAGAPREPAREVVRVHRATPAAHDAALLAALRADPRAWPDTAVLCRSRAEVGHYTDLIERAGIPVCLLAEYEGRPTAGVKIGGYVRAKGLDFKHVLLPRYDPALPGGGRGGTRGGEAARERSELARRRVFVAMVRARDTLWLGQVGTPAPRTRPATPGR